MKLDDLKEEHLIEIVRLYEKFCGFGRKFEEAVYDNPSFILEHLKKYLREEYRIGSKWEGHSKIYFEVDSDKGIVVRFNSNFDSQNRKGRDYKDAETAGKKFVEAVMRYLG